MTGWKLLRGGLVADGIGATTRPADVLIDGQVIAAVGTVGAWPEAIEVIDLPPGSVVCPGFIDAHVHAEGPLLMNGRVAGALAQGVTTLVAGQDGQSCYCAGSDGIYQGQHPHPRGYATFARLAGHYLAHHAETGYQQIARHLAANVADAYGLPDRGRLAPGMAADICVIGPGGITAHATYDAPARPATGVDLVLVNGAITWRHGHLVPAFPGRLVS